MELFEFEDIKALLELDGTAMSEYPALELIAEMVTASFEEYLGKLFEEEKRSFELYIENPTKLVSLKGLPVKNVTTLKVEGSDITDYTITGYGLRLKAAIGGGLLECTYTGGLPEVPAWLKRAAIYQTAYEFQSKDHIGADYVQTEGGSVGRPALELLKNVKLILDPHVHPLERFN